MVRHPAHRHLAVSTVTGGEGEVEQRRHLGRVVKEDLVEVTKAEEHDRVRILPFGRQVLLHYGG